MQAVNYFEMNFFAKENAAGFRQTSRKKKTRSSTMETKGTLIQYLSKYIVGGEDKAVGGKKRKVEATVDGLTGYDMDQKRIKTSVDPEQPDGGPKSATETDPKCNQDDWIDMDRRTPKGFQQKFTI